jgi:chemotaxis response regulator CheB
MGAESAPGGGADDPVGMEMVAALKATDRALRAGAVDAVGVQAQRALQDAHRGVVIAGVQRAARARRGRERQRDCKRDEKVSCGGLHMGSGGRDADSRKDLNLATKNSSFAGFLA